MQIIDGSGKGGYRATVNAEGRLVVEAIESSKLQDEIYLGHAYVWVFTGYDYDAADTVFFLRNDHTEKILVIDSIELYCDTATKVQLHQPANPTAAGTAISGKPLNRRLSKDPKSTAIQDETGNTQGTILKNTYIAANGVMSLLRENECIILGYHQCLGVDLVTAGTMAYGQIVGHFKQRED